jgi:outer membrane protein assembly factor BamD
MHRRAAIALCLFVLSASCATDSGIRIPAETNYQEGEKLYAREKYEKAVEKWRKVKESNTSPLLKTVVELRIADALFQDENFIEAAAEYENFRKLHPKNPKAPYALYMLGVSNFSQVEKIDVDQTPVKNAVTVFESFLLEYPNTDMAKKAREKLAECKSRQAAHEIYVGRFYYRTDKYGAAIGRFTEALGKYPGAPVNDEALFLLGDSYLRTGEKVKGRETMARLVKEYPKSRFAEKAKSIIGKNS